VKIHSGNSTRHNPVYARNWNRSSRRLNASSRSMGRITVIASKEDEAPVFRCKWSSGFAAAVYVLAALPGTKLAAVAGQSAAKTGELKPDSWHQPGQAAASVKPAPVKVIVVVTGKLDLGKITIADFGDVEPANR
jgi:hypothetical protein